MPETRRIFLSSTREDLTEYREAVSKAISRLENLPVGMEAFSAQPRAPVPVCRAEVERCDALVVIVAHRCGWIPSPDQERDGERSITRIEVEAALEAGKPVFAFLVGEAHPWSGPREQDRMVDPEVLASPERLAEVGRHVQSLLAFKKWLQNDAGLTTDTFTTPDDLAAKVTASLAKWILGEEAQVAGPSSAAALRAHFGSTLANTWARTKPLALHAATGDSPDAEEVPIFSVYTALDITERVSVELEDPDDPEETQVPGRRPEQASRFQLDLADRLRREVATAEEDEQRTRLPFREPHEGRAVTALEAASLRDRLVLLGPPGSGKSTFARHLACCLAGEALDRHEANNRALATWDEEEMPWAPWEKEATLPLFVELRHFVASPCFPALGTAGEVGHLLAYLEHRAAEPAEKEEAIQLGEAFDATRGSGLFLMLDGLDETPRSGECRERLKQVIASFCERFPEARVLVTSRPYAYEQESAWRLDGHGFEDVTLAPFTPGQRQSFCRHWYQGMAARKAIEPSEIEERGADLWRELSAQPYLEPLAERPLMLTMMAGLHTRHGHLPSSRATLYEESVKLLLDRWNQARRVGSEAVSEYENGDEPRRELERTLSAKLGMRYDQVRTAIEDLALEAQAARTAEGEKEASLISAGRVYEALVRHGGKGEADAVIDFLHQRSGILIAESREAYRFPHLSYQEYLAACRLAVDGFPARAVAEVEGNPELWREVVPLLIGRVAETPYAAWALVEAMLPGPPERLDPTDAGCFRSMLCAQGLVENELHRSVQTQDEPKLERVRDWLLATIECGALSERDRAATGEALGAIGDPRLQDEAAKRVRVLGGTFWMGAQDREEKEAGYDEAAFDREAPVHRVEVSGFVVGRFPVTVQEFARFAAEGGYGRADLWHPEGWPWREEGKIVCPRGWEQQLEHPSRPVVGVSWYEADAYCRSAGGRLPTEAEWEYLARGEEGRRYPWGDDSPSDRHANFSMRIGSPTPVGLYPEDRHPLGVRDLAGNVWEWCSDWYGDYPPEEQIDPAGPEAGGGRVLRGGSFYRGPRYLRAACRLADGPQTRNVVDGFRVVWLCSGGQ